MNDKAKSAKRYSGWRWKWLREGRRFVLLVAAAAMFISMFVVRTITRPIGELSAGLF